MVNEEIMGGLRTALNRGETLLQAMMTFFNAGYPKSEIEEAGRTLQLEGREKAKPVQNVVETKKEEKSVEKPKEKSVEEIKTKQKVSGYENKKEKNVLVIFLIITLVLLLGALASMFLFKEKVLEILGNIFD